MLFSGTVAFSWSAWQRLDVIGASRMPWFVDNSVRSYACSTTLPIFLGVDIKTWQLRHSVRAGSALKVSEHGEVPTLHAFICTSAAPRWARNQNQNTGTLRVGASRRAPIDYRHETTTGQVLVVLSEAKRRRTAKARPGARPREVCADLSGLTQLCPCH